MLTPLADKSSPENGTGITRSLVFEVDRVEKTDAPDGEPQQDWYRYVLKNHKSTITGLRRGTHQHVCDYAAEYAEQLNARILFGSSRWSPNGSKIAPRNR